MTGIAWFLLTASLPLPPAQAPDIPACGVELRVRAKAPVAEVTYETLNPGTAFEIELVNAGDRAVTLVKPGDGSGVAWRTPVLRWAVVSDAGYEPPPMARCGNVNPLRPDEAFILAPGERRKLYEWIPPVSGMGPGVYRLRLSYINDPTLEWQGAELAPHDAASMQQVRTSTPCRAVSNQVTIRVVSRQP